jgi:acetyl-CoA acetyltransferase
MSSAAPSRFGHPVGASGGRLMTNLLRVLEARGGPLRPADHVRKRRHGQRDVD